MDFIPIFFTIILIFIVVILISSQIRLLYRRYIYTYKNEVISYLNDRKLTLRTYTTPNNLDWKSSPFTKPKRFKTSPIITTINGANITWRQKDYKIINTEEKETIWLEIDTTYFFKPKLTFTTSNTKVTKKTFNKNTIIVTDTCLGCNFKLKERDLNCPDCGLSFS